MLCMARLGYGKGFDTETFEAGAGSLSFCGLWWFSVVSLGFRPGLLPSPASFFQSLGLRSGGSVDTCRQKLPCKRDAVHGIRQGL